MTQFMLISHRRDLDGISSAALMVRYAAKHRLSPFYLMLKDYSDELQIVEDRVLSVEGAEFMLADLATDQKFIDGVADRLRTLKSRGNRITWMDHHPTKDSIVRELSSVVDVLDLRESRVTGSMIVHDRLYEKNGIRDPHAEMLSRLGRDSDLMELKYDVTPKLVSLIDYYHYVDGDSVFYPDLVQLALHLASPKVEADERQLLGEHHLRQVEYYESLKRSEKDKILRGVETFRTGGLSFAIFHYPTLFSGSQISAHVLEANDVDASVGFNESGTGSVRRKNERVSCRQIASLLGGGGHEFAAGMNLGFEIADEKDVERAKSVVKEKLREVYPG